MQIVQLYFLALTGIRSKITGIQEISWSEKKHCWPQTLFRIRCYDLRNVWKEIKTGFKFLRVFIFFCLLHNPEHSKEVKQGNIWASFLFCSVTFCCLGKNQKLWCAENEKGVLLKYGPRRNQNTRLTQWGFAGGFAMLF